MYVNLEQNVAYSLKPSESVKLIVQPNGFKFCKTFQQVQLVVFVWFGICFYANRFDTTKTVKIIQIYYEIYVIFWNLVILEFCITHV